MVQTPSKKRKALNEIESGEPTQARPQGNEALSERGRTADASNGAEADGFG